MKIKIMLAIVMLSIMFPVVACSTAAGNPSAKEVSILAAGEFEKTPHMQKQVEVDSGGNLVVTLVSNASTGFSWNQSASIADAGIIQQVGYQDIAAEGGKVGAPGAQQWTFKALKSGTTTVHLEYSRPWEGGEKGVWTFDLTINVK